MTIPLDSPSTTAGDENIVSLRRHARLVVALVLALFYLLTAFQNAHRNSDPIKHDQSAYLAEAKELADSHYSALTGRNRMPAYLYLLSAIYSPRLSDVENFHRARALSVLLTLPLLLIVNLTLRAYLSVKAADTLTYICAFAV